jgi:hypothetical protein
MRAQIIASIVLCATLLSTQAALAQGKRPERVSILGCLYPGVTASCLMLKAANGTVYNISSISPRPRQPDRMIRVRGVVTDKMSMCGEGVVLDRIRWTRTRQHCPN